jgi:hypothetical protein
MLAALLLTLLTTSGAFIMFEPADQDISQEETALDPEPEPAPAPETSGSEIVDASAIFLLRVDTANFGPWTNPPEGGQVRTVKLRFTLLEVLKGRLTQASGEAFDLDVLQHGGPLQDPGLWGAVKLDPGTQLVAYTQGAPTDARLLLTDPLCIRLAEARKVLEDTRAAMLIENRNASSDTVLSAAATAAERFGDLFARYVWTRVKDSVLASQPKLDEYLALVENPKTRPDARSAYLSALYDDLGMVSRPPRESEIKLAQSMFRLLLLPEAESLHTSIGGVFLPNLLRADAKTPKFTPAEILTPARLDRTALLRVVNGLAAEEERAKRLAAWLQK